MKKKKGKKPLDMTTDEAMKYLFPKKVVGELKRVAKPLEKARKPPKNKGDKDNRDSTYI